MALGAIFAAPAIVLTLGHAILGRSMSSLLAVLTAGLGFLLLARRYDLERIGPTRCNPGPRDHVLSARERLWSTATGFALLGLALGIHFLIGSDESLIAGCATLVSGKAALALIARGRFDESLSYAEKLKAVPDIERFSRVALAVDAFRKKDYAAAETWLKLTVESDLDR